MCDKLKIYVTRLGNIYQTRRKGRVIIYLERRIIYVEICVVCILSAVKTKRRKINSMLDTKSNKRKYLC